MVGYILGLIVLYLWNDAIFVSSMTCGITHPQTSFCSSDFVIQGKVLDISENAVPFMSRKVNVQVLATYKTNEKTSGIEDGKTIRINAFDQWMKWNIEPGQIYLLTGKVYNEIYYTTGCDWVQNWYKISHVQMWGLKSYYKRNCHCIVSEQKCENRNCCLWETKDLAAAEQRADCASLKGICMSYYDGSCSWFRARMGPACVE